MDFEVIIIFIKGISLVLEPNMGLTVNVHYVSVPVLQPHPDPCACTARNTNQPQFDISHINLHSYADFFNIIFALCRNINSQNKRYWSSKYPRTVQEFLCETLKMQSGVL
jgi:hypothetical protein